MWTTIYEGSKWKICTKCLIEKPEPDYYKQTVGPKTRKDGLSIWCRLCFSQHAKRSEVREMTRKYRREYMKRAGVRPRRQSDGRRYYDSGKGRNKKKEWAKTPNGKTSRIKSRKAYRANPDKTGERYGILVRFARVRGIAVELSREDYVVLARQKTCHYCSCNMATLCKAGHGLDRKDSSLGYSIGNVVRCCGRCNYMKRRMSYEHFVLLSPALRQIRKLEEGKHE